MALIWHAPRCGTAGDLYSQRTCTRCVLADRLHTWISAEAPNHHQLQPLVTSLATGPKPRSVISWLSTSPVPPLLRDLADRPDPITHDLLDTITPSTTTLHNARSLLVETGVLAPRAEYLDRITPWLEHVLSTVPAQDARLVRQFTNWWLLRRARSRSRTHPYTSAAADGVRNKVSTAIGFLAWLRAEGTELAQASQAHIDRWLTDGPRHRRILRAFIQWARRRHLVTDLDVPPIPVAAASHLQDDQDQWQQLHRCLHETTMPVHLRVVGALVLLFGLSVTRLTALTVGQIEQDETGTHLLLTGHRLLVPTALARLLIEQRTQAASRWAVTTTTGIDRPLFPGLHGRPTHPEVLRAKLKQHGIRPRAGRNTALAALAVDLPPAVLADLFGIGLTTATQTSRTPESGLFDANGKQRLPDDARRYVAARLNGASVLMFSVTPSHFNREGHPTTILGATVAGKLKRLGEVPNLRSQGCSWNTRYLTCPTATTFKVWRFAD